MSKCPPWTGWWLFLQKWSDSEGSPWLLASTPVSPSGLTVFSVSRSAAGRRSWGKSHKRFQKILHFFSTLSKDWFGYDLDSWRIGWNILISLFCRLPWPPPGLPPQNEDLLDLADALADLARAARETRTTLWSALQVSSSLLLVNEISFNRFVRLHNLLNWIARLPQAFESWKLRTYPQTNGVKRRNRLRIPRP